MGCGASSQPDSPAAEAKAESGPAAAESQSAPVESGSKAAPAEESAPASDPEEAAPVVSDPAASPLVPVPGSADDHLAKSAGSELRAVDDSNAQTVELADSAVPELESKEVSESEAQASAEAAAKEAAWSGPETSMVQSRLHIQNNTSGDVLKRFESGLPAGATGLTKIQFRDVLPDMATTAPLLVDRLFGCFDTDKDGLVDLKEFKAVLASLCSNANESEKCRIVFGLYDSDGDGFVTKAELEEVLRAYFWSRTVVIEEMSVEEFDDFDEEPAPQTASKAPVGVESKEILEEFVAEIFKGDENDDKLLSFEEFEKWLLSDAKSSMYANVMVKWVDVLVGGVKPSASL